MTKKQHEKKVDVIIVGAGVPGCMLALKLAKTGLKILVVEKEKSKDFSLDKGGKFVNGRSVALMVSACKNLKEWGILDKLKEIICPLEALQIIDDSHFPEAVENNDKMLSRTFYADELGEAYFGYNIPLEPLLACVRNVMSHHDNIEFLDDTLVNDIFFTETHVDVVLGADALTYRAALIIGADGRGSIVREKAGVEIEKRDYGTKAITCVISHEREHDQTSTEFHRSGGPFTLVPLPHNKSAIVWCEKDVDADQFMALDEQALENAIQERSRDIVGRIKLESKPFAWPIISMHSAQITAPRCALMAEAAHVMSPIGAQGMNLSLRDMEDLANIVSQAALNGLDIGGQTTLYRYAQSRKQDMWRRGRGVDLYHRSVANKNPVMRSIRRATLQAASVITPLREVLMREGLSIR